MLGFFQPINAVVQTDNADRTIRYVDFLARLIVSCLTVHQTAIFIFFLYLCAAIIDHQRHHSDLVLCFRGIGRGFSVVDAELSARQQLVLAVGLDQVKTVGLGDGGVGIGLVALTEMQVGSVDVGLIILSTVANFCISGDHCSIADDQTVIGIQMLTELRGENNIECVDIFVCFCGRHKGVVGNSRGLTIFRDFRSGPICGFNTGSTITNHNSKVTRVLQTRFHFVMESVVLCAVMDMDSNTEIYILTDVSGVDLAPLPAQVFLNLLFQSGNTILGVDYAIGVGGAQTAQGTDGGVHQVVAQLQVFKDNAVAVDGVLQSFTCSSSGGLGRCNTLCLRVCQSQLCKVCDTVCIGTAPPCQNTLFIRANIVIAGTGGKEGFPVTIYISIVVRTGVEIEAVHLQDLIDLVGCGGFAIFNGNTVDGNGTLYITASTAGGSFGSGCGCCHCQRQNHENCQCQGNELFHDIYFLSKIKYMVFAGIKFTAQYLPRSEGLFHPPFPLAP